MRSSLALLPLLVVLGGCVPPSDRLYETRLAMLRAEDEIERVSAAYVAKYELPPRKPDSPPMRYWRVEPRS